MLRDWRPPQHPEPDEAVARREYRKARSPEPVWGRRPVAAAVRRTVQNRALFPLLTAMARPEVVGGHHLATLRGPVIIAPNHVSHVDAPVMLQALPAHLRERTLVPAAADYFFDRRWLSAVVTITINAVPFDRRNEIADSVRRCERFLRHGYSIVLFPEGTRSLDGRLRGFKAGVAHLAANTGAPVVPVYLQGTHRLLPRGKAVPRPSAVCVHVGEPLFAGPEESARQFNTRLEDAVIALAAQARGWQHRDRVPEARSWRESWAASRRDAVVGVDSGSSEDGAWRDAVRAEPELPPPASPGEPGSWMARWRSTTPR
jgi:1-acyl-sn-glycerol-3-phosphate acyltransferase